MAEPSREGITRFNPEEHQPLKEDGWVYHYGIVVFSATDHTGETFHVYCFRKDAPESFHIAEQHLGGAIQTS